ncbi:MAG: alanine racemase [Alphaproteobacteria bacterium]|nr:alanine racemase [Alphaproteobacteria bacterium]
MASATLSVNLSALRANYQLLKNRHAKKSIASVVKANAYGLGVAEVSKALAAEGCTLFFVATLDEAMELRGTLPKADIAVFNGIFKGEETEFKAHNIIPVANDLEQGDRCQVAGVRKYFVHVDTGMTRLGLSETDIGKFLSQSPIPNPQPLLLLSHLSCANDPAHPKNAEQLLRLKEAQKYFPNAPVSFANSSGLFLPDEYHFDLGRPGCALYGINPVAGENPMRHVATLSAPILQIRELDRDESVGYGATFEAGKNARIAIVGLGYSDGYFRSLSNRGVAFIAGHKVPIVGRISMDMIALDVSQVPASAITENSRAEFINVGQTVDDIAEQCGTIGYEVFTRIGRRVRRIYTES